MFWRWFVKNIKMATVRVDLQLTEQWSVNYRRKLSHWFVDHQQSSKNAPFDGLVLFSRSLWGHIGLICGKASEECAPIVSWSDFSHRTEVHYPARFDWHANNIYRLYKMSDCFRSVRRLLPFQVNDRGWRGMSKEVVMVVNDSDLFLKWWKNVDFSMNF